jgi:hypothetical protein
MEKRESEIIKSLLEAIKALEQQLADAQNRIAELEAKYESN